MKLYNSLGPNPRMVRMFLEEKGLERRTAEARRHPAAAALGVAG